MNTQTSNPKHQIPILLVFFGIWNLPACRQGSGFACPQQAGNLVFGILDFSYIS